MPVHKTAQNRVIADDPEPDDLFVQVVWHGPPEDGGRHCREFEGPPWPIEEYDKTVQWAVGIADQMRFPLYVVPLRAVDAMRTERVRQAVARLTNQERGELRRGVVATLAEVNRGQGDERWDTQDLTPLCRHVRLGMPARMWALSAPSHKSRFGRSASISTAKGG